MFLIRLAELTVAIDHQYDYIQSMCKDYVVQTGAVDFSVSVTEQDILAEGNVAEFFPGYLESLAIYRKIAERLPDYDGFLMHGVLLEIEGTGITFLAKSGVGKTTHAKLWQEFLGGKAAIINGDKPLVRLENGQVMAFGTPWAGKENLQINRSTALNKICFIERAETNICRRIGPAEGLMRLIPQVYRSKSEAGRHKTLDLLSNLAGQASFYVMECNTDISAALVAYEGMML